MDILLDNDINNAGFICFADNGAEALCVCVFDYLVMFRNSFY